MRIIRSRAGFLDLNGLNFNPRTKFAVPEELRDQVFPWLKNARAKFLSALNIASGVPVARDRVTAFKFLEFMDRLQDVVIQDAAAILIEYPERGTHGLFSLPIFQCKQFHDYKLALKTKLETVKAPWDTSIEMALPGVNSKFLSVSAAIDDVKDDSKTILNCLHQREHQIIPRSDQIPTQLIDELRDVFCKGMAGFTAAVSPKRRKLNNDSNNDNDCASDASTTSIIPTFIPQPRLARFAGDGYKLPLKARSSTEMWCVWFGVGKYDQIPVLGGVEYLETNHKSKWRCKYTVQEKKQFYRWKKGVSVMVQEFGDRDATTELDFFLAEMDAVFVSAGSFSRFVDVELVKRSKNVKKSSENSSILIAGVQEGVTEENTLQDI